MPKKVLISIALIYVCLFVFSLFSLIVYFVGIFDDYQHRYYSTTDLADYGEYIGNHNNKFPQAFIPSFFPEEISTSFSDVSYSYRAEKTDAYAFEAYLEFTIQDANMFQQYIASVIGKNETEEFPYDSSFFEYTVKDILWIFSPICQDCGEETPHYHIEDAQIGKILFSIEEQRIIYVAIGVRDGGATTTSYLSTYFNRFDIDPMEYKLRLDTTAGNRY